MKNATNITHEQVSQLIRVLEAGFDIREQPTGQWDERVLWMTSDRKFGVEINATSPMTLDYFDSIHDAWCKFTGRDHICPRCKGEGYKRGDPILSLGGDEMIVCDLCQEFGKITQEQLNEEVEMRR